MRNWLDDKPNHPSKFSTRNLVKINNTRVDNAEDIDVECLCII